MKNGLLVVNKPAGISSAGVVARVKKMLRAGKVGHTGTLDPFATGLMLCAVNQATRISRYFLEGHKRYDARLHLGVETDTHDMTGNVTHEAGVEQVPGLSSDEIADAVFSFRGEQDQVPPSYSALKHNGTPLYKLARQGKFIEKPPRQITIFEIEIRQISLPYVDLSVHCSAGTYIRTLAFDIGRRLGCGAHLNALCRTGSGKFSLAQALELERLEKMCPEERWEQVRPMADCLDFMPFREVDESLMKKIRFGQKLGPGDLDPSGLSSGQPCRLIGPDGDLAAIVEPGENGKGYNYACVFAQ